MITAHGFNRAAMNRLRTLVQDDRRLVAWLLAFVFFARILVPAGWMPSADQGRWVEICTGDSTAKIWLDDQGKAHPGKAGDSQHKGSACVFGAASFAFDLPVVAALPPLVAIATPIPAIRSLTLAIGRGLAAPPPPKTGPPTLN